MDEISLLSNQQTESWPRQGLTNGGRLRVRFEAYGVLNWCFLCKVR
jgi:hypothetical protein